VTNTLSRLRLLHRNLPCTDGPSSGDNAGTAAIRVLGLKDSFKQLVEAPTTALARKGLSMAVEESK